MKRFLLIILLLCTVSCAGRGISKNGYALDQKDIDQIKVGVTDKDAILELLDYPSATSHSNKNKWIYCSYNTKRLMFFKPKVVKQDVLVVSFDEKTGIVKNLAQYSLNDGKQVETNNARTKIASKDQGVIKDFIRNIGSVTPGI